MDYRVHFLIFGAVVWAFTFFGIALHVADVNRRARKAEMPLDQYWRPRPIEWLLSGLLLLACGAAVLGSVQFWGLNRAGTEMLTRYQVIVAAAVSAVGLTYVALRGRSWLTWARDEFIHSAGATSPREGRVMVNLALEAEYDTAIVKRTAWTVYIVGCIPLAAAALLAIAVMALPALVAVLAAIAGGAMLYTIVTNLPGTEEDENW